MQSAFFVLLLYYIRCKWFCQYKNMIFLWLYIFFPVLFRLRTVRRTPAVWPLAEKEVILMKGKNQEEQQKTAQKEQSEQKNQKNDRK